MKRGGIGGANTKTGREFEEEMDILKVFEGEPGYAVVQAPDKSGHEIHFQGKTIAKCFKQAEFYKFLNKNGIATEKGETPQYRPDYALIVIVRETLFIFELKFQQSAGSTDIKLAACDFLRRYYAKLVHPLNLKVEFVYILSEWFRQPKYADLLEYMTAVNCHYRFDKLPLSWLGLPSEDDDDAHITNLNL